MRRRQAFVDIIHQTTDKTTHRQLREKTHAKKGREALYTLAVSCLLSSNFLSIVMFLVFLQSSTETFLIIGVSSEMMTFDHYFHHCG